MTNQPNDQITRETLAMWQKLTDPAEREKAEMKEKEKAFIKNLSEEAGL